MDIREKMDYSESYLPYSDGPALFRSIPQSYFIINRSICLKYCQRRPTRHNKNISELILI